LHVQDGPDVGLSEHPTEDLEQILKLCAQLHGLARGYPFIEVNYRGATDVETAIFRIDERVENPNVAIGRGNYSNLPQRGRSAWDIVSSAMVPSKPVRHYGALTGTMR
jgi:hypothetical protein